MANTFSDLSNSMADTVKSAGQAVLRIEARRRLPASGIVWTADGLIVTANHVVRREEQIPVAFADGSTTTARLLGRDPTTDLALLKADASDLTTLTQVQPADLAVGQLVLALGRPGHNTQATLGVVSGLGGAWRTRGGGKIDHYLQTDVLMYPGFSGGPLVGAGPGLLGMNTSGLLSGVSVAVPVDTINRVVDGLATHGRLKRGYLGVSTQRVRLPKDLWESLNQKSGLIIVDVEVDSPAEAGGLKLGDTIIGLGEIDVHTHEDLLAQLGGDLIGQKVPIKILRGGEIQTMNVKIGERP